jgi:hypothetical protein
MNAKERALQALEFNRTCTNNLLKDFPEDKGTFQPSPHCNHAIWIMGHLAVTDEWMHGMIAEVKTKLPESYGKLFGYQTQPQSSAKAYPSFAEVKKNYQAARDNLLKAAHAVSDEALCKPLGEKGGGFVSDGLDALHKSAWHEGWHAGQLATVRRALGLPSSF